MTIKATRCLPSQLFHIAIVFIIYYDAKNYGGITMEWFLDVVEKFSNTFNFDNIGAKIKKLTKWACWISILLIWVSSFFQVIAWIYLELYVLLWIPIISAIITPYLIWMSFWFSYGFGELVENSCKKPTTASFWI